MLVDEVFIKFSALVGRSILKVSAQFIDLGISRKIEEGIRSSFTLHNQTTSLPLLYEVIPNGSKMRIAVPKMKGKLEGSEISGGQSSEVIEFIVTPRDFGLWYESITVCNVTCSDQKFDIFLKLFVDEGLILSDLDKIGETSFHFKNIYFNASSLRDLDAARLSLYSFIFDLI
jgi:hypothetical protein